MDFTPTNHKNKETIHKFNKTRLVPLNTQKYKKTQELRIKLQICNQPRDPRIATFDSLELNQLVCCWGIKLGNRKNKSVQKKHNKKIDNHNPKNKIDVVKEGIKLCKVSTTDSLGLDIKSILLRNNKKGYERKVKLNPEQRAHLRNIPRIARNDILMSKKQKNGKTAFLKKENKKVVLYEEIESFILVGSHPNLLQPFSLVSLDSGSYFIVDECDCQNLRSLVTQFGKVHPKMTTLYIKQIVSALAHLKAYGKSHNRINMQTIFHNGDGGILINWIKSSNKAPTEQQKSKYFHYFCPEILLSKGTGFGEKADVWAVGCLALQLLSVTSPKNNPLHPYNRKSNIYRNPESIQNIQKIQSLMPGEQKTDKAQPLSPQRTTLKQQAQLINASTLQFIGKCLSVNVHQRPSLHQVLLHPFIK